MIAGLGEVGDVAPHAGKMEFEGSPAVVFARGLCAVGVSVQRHLGINDQVAAAGQK